MKNRKTVNDVYGDVSANLVWKKCGYCITCGDYGNYGCGSETKRLFGDMFGIDRKMKPFTQKDKKEFE